MSEESNSTDICSPILTLDELLNNQHDKLHWGDQVEPLAKRSSPRPPNSNLYSMDSSTNHSTENHPQVLVCHDYKGNYLDDKFINDGTKWEDYRFYNWSVVDIFCYFSHNLVTIPTLQYINAAHRNGVKVIGTLIFEHDEGRKAINDMLTDKEQTEKVAMALIEVAKTLKFEGWLLNVEVSVNPQKLPLLKHFARFMTEKTHEEISDGIILWYDSVSAVDGILHGQSELNAENCEFFELCDGIITDYKWREAHVERTSKFVDEKYPNCRKDVYFGIDIFGRGQTAGFRTNETLSISAAQKFSTSIFAPGWTIEHIDSKIVTDSDSLNREFLERNDQFWTSLYKYFYIYGPKSLPFVTNFCLGSGKRSYRMGKVVKGNWFNLKAQAFQPSMPSSNGHFTHCYEDAFNGGSCLSIDTNELIRIFTCELSCKDGLIFSCTTKKEPSENELEVHFNVLNTSTNRGLKIVCKKDEQHVNDISSLKSEDVRSLNIFLANKGYAPTPELINSWETQYFLLNFDKSSSADIIVTDIGVKKIHKGKVLLGQIALYSAIDFECDSVEGKVIGL
ncbi:cytosolic endo-beta-N-acetylglucosaminidase-like [Chironomus tepperi]|uniref:cytosolic endo-beta-N-acetylglucosaminidase-like n=1 Tax=Chironomus tepperi TaxID=113505 RepID=UPI00391F838D